MSPLQRPESAAAAAAILTACLVAGVPAGAVAAEAARPRAELPAFVDLVGSWSGRVFCPPRGTTIQDLGEAVTAFSMVHPELDDRLNNEQTLRALALRHPCDPARMATRGPDARLRRAFRDGEAPLVSVAPVFSQLLWMSLPAGFQAAPAREQLEAPRHYVRELVPEGESAERWTEKITVTADQGAAADAGLSPKLFLATRVAAWRAACPESFVGSAMPADRVSGYEAYAAIVSCGTAPDTQGEASESAILVAIRGEKDFYLLQWAERGQPWSTPMTIDSQHWYEKLARLTPVKLCPIVPGEGPPWPSCIPRP